METEQSILQRAEAVLRKEIGPVAGELDADAERLRWALQRLCDEHLMALRRPTEYGGPGFGEVAFRDFQEMVARYSGALAFLQTQHQSAVSMIAKGDNHALRSEILPYAHDGTRLLGIGFSQLRRPGPPICRAEPVDSGYRISGTVPWVTGLTFFPEFLIGAALPDGQAVFGIVPLREVRTDGGSIALSAPMRLAAMESALTVSAEFTDWRLPHEQVVFVKPSGWIVQNDMINIVLQGFFALGCAQGALDVLEGAYQRKRAEFIGDTWRSLGNELQRCRAELLGMLPPATAPEGTKLRVRAWAIELCARCAHAAVVSCSGASNQMGHPAQRIYREALVFSVSAQTTDIMQATLERLVNRGVGP